MVTRSINVGIIDAYCLFPKILRNFLSEEKNISVLFQSSGVSELYQNLRSHPIDILVVDALIPGQMAVDIVKVVRDDYHGVGIVVISISTDLNFVSHLLDLGVNGYISNGDDPDDLLRAITAAAKGNIYRNKLFTDVLYMNKQADTKNNVEREVISLNEREKKILQMLWEEKSNKEIASHLHLSVKSIEKTRQDIKNKLGIRSTIGLIKYGLSKKIITNHSVGSDSA